MLELYLYLPMIQDDFMNMIRNLRYLESIDICFMKPDDYYKVQLSDFKRKVNDCFENELKVNDFFFKIQIHTDKNGHTFIRYLFKRGKSMIEYPSSYFRDEKNKMFMLVGYRKNIKNENKNEIKSNFYDFTSKE